MDNSQLVDLRDLERENERLLAEGEPLWVFLDDVPETRIPSTREHAEWIRVTSAWSCIGLLELRRGGVAGLDLDHDLSISQMNADLPTGYDVLLHLAERQEADGNDLWPTRYLCVHAATVVGRDRMVGVIERYATPIGFDRDMSQVYPTWRRSLP